MKIAIVRKKYTPYGGAERYLHGLIGRLIEMGHEIHVYANTWPSLKGQNIFFHKVPMIGGLSLLKIWSFALATWILIRRERFDIVFSNERTFIQDIYRAADGCHRGWLSVRFRQLTFWRKLSIIVNPLHGSVLFFDWLIFRKRRFKKVIALSNQSKQEIMQRYDVPPDMIHVIYNGVDLELFHPRNRMDRDTLRRELGITNHEYVLLYVGTGFERKGLKYLIEAVAQLKQYPFHLLVIGRNKTSLYRKLAKKLGIETYIHFLGAINGVAKYYGAADIFVFPTLYEPFGNVHLEALASGLPVITSAMSGGSEIITAGLDGDIIKDPTNPCEIADKIRSVIEQMREINMGYEARKKAETFTFERTISESLDIFKSIHNIKS